MESALPALQLNAGGLMRRKRSFALEFAIRYLCLHGKHPLWVNLTFAENVEDHVEAERRWKNLCQRMKREWPGVRFAGVWARQSRGAWHLHLVGDRYLDVNVLRPMALECGFGPQIKLKSILKSGEGVQERDISIRKIARYVSGYCTDTNALDPVRDAGVRRLVYVNVSASSKVNLRFNWARGMGALLRAGRSTWSEMNPGWRMPCHGSYNFESTRDFLIRLGFESLIEETREWLLSNCDVVRRWWYKGEDPVCPF